ncbi:hypothetical protein HMPREF0201_04648 [Cedecea davisae DSM 4568]|uniref:Uncharacterized protein n=1 Tax=Cedecea davisae DSM 4568 TaxID=566551 RepID=S3IIZ9_9ENTR|nr:hypothetical protein HMPREF0201_04648 [Cedecea davisae DSM 4568]
MPSRQNLSMATSVIRLHALFFVLHKPVILIKTAGLFSMNRSRWKDLKGSLQTALLMVTSPVPGMIIMRNLMSKALLVGTRWN